MSTTIDRRGFLRRTAATGAALAAGGMLGAVGLPGSRGDAHAQVTPPFRWLDSSIADMQAAMASGEATAVQLVRDHLDRIERLDWAGPTVNSIIEVNPDAETIAAALDAERAAGQVRGPLHGIPVVLKDSIATADRMETTAGSLALVGSRPPRDSGVATKLREAGAILLGKANMSEWNAFRGWPLHGGWSGRVGIGQNPHILGYSTGDSSSGSAAAVAASFAAGAVGLETYGSIVMPSSLCGVVGLKPTAGLISRSGTIPISFTRDATGPIARTVTDLAILLAGMVGSDPLDPSTTEADAHARHDYTRGLTPDGLRGARIGVWRHTHLWKDEPTAAVVEEALSAFEEAGATLVDPVHLPNWLEATGHHVGVMYTEFRHGVERYLATLDGSEIRTLADVIEFNRAHRAEELRWHSQGTLEWGLDQPPLTDPAYRRDLVASTRLARGDFDRVMGERHLDAIVAPTFVRAWAIDLLAGDPPVGNGVAGPSNAAGYPNLTVPAGFADHLPIGISFLGRAWDEPRLLRYAYAFEQAIEARRPPTFLSAGRDPVTG